MRRLRGVFFTMDAAAALLIILISTATVFSLLSMSEQSSESMLTLSRESRDAFEINRTGPIPASINRNCASANITASTVNVYYDNATHDVVTKNITVCP